MVHNLCYFLGFAIQTLIIMFIGFWNAHVLHMLYSMAFPFRANCFMTSHHLILLQEEFIA